MTGKKWFSWVVALAVALPFAAAAESPGEFKIPGTDTTLKIYGFARTDISFDLNRKNGWPTDITGAVSENAAGDPELVQFTARNSRFGFTTATPSDIGEIGVKVEGDFYKVGANDRALRLRHAFGTVGKFLLIGQTDSNWQDKDAESDTVDWGSYMTGGASRYAQIRLIAPIGEKATLSFGIENPTNPAPAAAPVRTVKQLPDLTARLKLPMDFGHISARGVVVPVKNTQKSSVGYGGGLSGAFDLSGDTFVWEVLAGAGIPGYMDVFADGDNDARGFVADANGDLNPWQAVSYTLGYTHVFSPSVRANLVWSHGIVKNDEKTRNGFEDETNQRIYQAFGNVYYTAAKNFEVGLEYTWGQRVSFTNEKGTISRVNLAATYKFF